MKKGSITKTLEDHKASLWSDLFGDIEVECLGGSSSWAAETFVNNLFCNNIAGVRFAVHKVIIDSLDELDLLLEVEDDKEDVRLWLTPEAVSAILTSDAARVFKFLVLFVRTCAEEEINLFSDPTERLRAIQPQVVAHQANFESMMLAKIEKAFAEQRGVAVSTLEKLDI